MHWSRKEGFINKDTWAFRSSQGQKIGDVKPAPHQNLGVDGRWTCCFFLFPMQFRGILSAWLEVAASMGLKDDLNLPYILLGWVSRKMHMVSLGSQTYRCLQNWIGLLWDGARRRPDPANEANLYDGHCLLHIWANVNLCSAIAQSSLMWALNNCSCIVLWCMLPVKRLSLHTYSQQSENIRKCSKTLIIFFLLTNKICRSCTYFYFILILLSFTRTDLRNHCWKL